MYDYTKPAHVTSLAGPMAKWHSPKINDKENWTAFNLEKANELLDNAGYKWKNKNERIDSNGSPLKFEYNRSFWLERLGTICSSH